MSQFMSKVMSQFMRRICMRKMDFKKEDFWFFCLIFAGFLGTI